MSNQPDPQPVQKDLAYLKSPEGIETWLDKSNGVTTLANSIMTNLELSQETVLLLIAAVLNNKATSAELIASEGLEDVYKAVQTSVGSTPLLQRGQFQRYIADSMIEGR